jgi:hypothetical protein
MGIKEVTTLYFEKPGPDNTDATLEAALRRAQELGLKRVAVASTTGATGVKAVEVFQNQDVVVVSLSAGFWEPGEQAFLPENYQAIEAGGGRVLTCTHAFAGVSRGVNEALGTAQASAVIARTLKTFGQGMKVAQEVALMAADAGLVPVGEPCIAIGGSRRGCDTALVLIPVGTGSYFDLWVMEILAKPRMKG